MKSFKVILSAISLFLISFGSKAQAVSVVMPQDNFSVKFTGVQENYLCFQVEITSNDNNSILKISDKTEGELYTQNWKPKYPFQFFKIEKKDGQQIIFNLKMGNKEITKTFSTTTRTVENTIVEENELVIL